DVDRQPGHPGYKTAQMQFADLGDRGLATNCRHTAFVEVSKLFIRFAGQIVPNISGDAAAHLHRHRADAGQRLPVLFQVGHVAYSEDVVRAGDGQVVVDEPPPRAVDLRAQPICQSSRAHPGRPDHGRGPDPFVAEIDSVFVNVSDL